MLCDDMNRRSPIACSVDELATSYTLEKKKTQYGVSSRKSANSAMRDVATSQWGAMGANAPAMGACGAPRGHPAHLCGVTVVKFLGINTKLPGTAIELITRVSEVPIKTNSQRSSRLGPQIESKGISLKTMGLPAVPV